MAGAVLAGGASTRYGRNKALEVFRGERLVERSLGGVRALCEPVFLVANDLTPYLDLDAVLLQDVVLHQGPLGGLYTALLFSPRDWVFVKATDMPFLVPELVELMTRHASRADVVTCLTEGGYQPLMALYHRRCLAAVADVLAQERRKVTAFYSAVRVAAIPEEEWRVADPQGRSFWNVNSPEDWERLPWI